jgi:redox-sensitive bicupin YhaK (pirin superfamily)
VSGPVGRSDDAETPASGDHGAPEVVEARQADVGGMVVRRSLPRPRRRTVGAWCFVDHFGPLAVGPTGGIDIGPHPHAGLQTVTYLLDGEVLHRDSLGSEQVIRPGQLNLMSAGLGVAHAEEPTGHYSGRMHGVQLWVAQPEATRGGPSAFEHHEQLPQVELDDAVATVLVGELSAAASDARQDTPLLGVSLALQRGGASVPLTPSHEHLVVVLDGTLVLGDAPLHPGQSAYLRPGRDELALAAPDGATVLLLGGEPFPEPIVMWWNFVARSKDEVREARTSWEAGDDRFGPVTSGHSRIPAPEI